MQPKIIQNKTIEILGFPMDLGAGRRGVDMGPSALRIAGLDGKLAALGYNVIDRGDLNIKIMEAQNIGDGRLKYLKEILKTSELLAQKVNDILERNNFPLIIGGDHSMALGVLGGISTHCRKNNLTLGVIWIDAHADMNTHETTPSGNIHGMPLAAALGYGYDKLVNFMGVAPKVKPENVALIGLRSIDPGEKQLLKDLKIPAFAMPDIDKLGIHRIISKILNQFRERVDHIHVSFDVDSVDPALAPGVGTPVPGGLSYREAHLLMENIAECGCMSSLEVAEVNPIFDNRNQSAEFTVDLIASSMGQRIL